jgi:hypothetical protein
MRFPLFLLALALGGASLAQTTSLTAIGKRHSDRADTIGDRPYGKDDISYGVFLDLFDGLGGWRLGASFSDDLSGAGEADSVITPEIALMAQDGFWETGISVLRDYVETAETSEWNSFYYQFFLGINIPLSKSLMIGAAAYYPFDSFSEIRDFSSGDLDFGVSLRLRF